MSKRNSGGNVIISILSILLVFAVVAFVFKFTNGLNEDLKNAKASDIMTKNPITAHSEMFASEAIKILNEKKITNLFVVEDNKAIGVIHIHDLLKAGIA